MTTEPALGPARPQTVAGMAADIGYRSNDFVELAFQLPHWQLQVLDDVARRCGVTIGEILRTLVRELSREKLCRTR